MNKIITVARIYWGVLPNRDKVDDPTKGLLHFYSNDKSIEGLWTKKYRNEMDQPDRFLIKNGFEPIGDNLYITK